MFYRDGIHAVSVDAIVEDARHDETRDLSSSFRIEEHELYVFLSPKWAPNSVRLLVPQS